MSKPTYRFYITMRDGTEVEWLGLSETVARNMYSYTNKRTPLDVVGCGWEEMT